jgi:hypothetical protein
MRRIILTMIGAAMPQCLVTFPNLFLGFPMFVPRHPLTQSTVSTSGLAIDFSSLRRLGYSTMVYFKFREPPNRLVCISVRTGELAFAD